MAIRTKKAISRTIYHIFMLAMVVVMIYPLVWLVCSSFKETKDVMRTARQLFVENPTIQNYIDGWKGFGGYTFTTYFKNTIIMTVVNVVAVIVSSSLTAFGFARVRFPGRKIWFAIMIGTMCLPGMVTQIPRYIMYRDWGWVGTWNPILIPAWFGGGAFNTFLLMQFMRNIPREMDEAARIDGCGWFGIYRRIVLPLIVPALCSVGVLTFIGQWGDYYSALIYLNKPQFYPVGYALKLYADDANVNYGPMFAMSVASITPTIILFFLFQKTLVEGISTSGIKG